MKAGTTVKVIPGRTLEHKRQKASHDYGIGAVTDSGMRHFIADVVQDFIKTHLPPRYLQWAVAPLNILK